MIKTQIKSPELIKDLGLMYPTETSKQKIRYCLYKCECGNEFKSQKRHVDNEKTLSCGCYALIRAREANITHGQQGTKLYSVWRSMNDRCYNRKQISYDRYGGRGISVCKEWRESFIPFYEWAMKNGYDKNLSIDRINNDGNYEPSNCRWSNIYVQARNTRRIAKNNTSGYRGVSWCKRSKKWSSNIRVNCKLIHLGYFSEKIDAAIAYDRYVKENKLEHTINGVKF